MKEASYNIRLFLQAAEMRDSLRFHALFCQVLEFAHDSGFEISLNPFVRIEFGRVTWQHVERNLPIEGFHELFDLLGLVGRVAVDDEEYLAFGAVNQTLDEFNELVGPDRTLDHHEPQHALRTDCGDHVEPEARACRLDRRSLTFRSPGGPGVVIGADPGLVPEPDFALAAGGRALDGRKLFLKPSVDGFRILLVGPPKRTLGREAELFEHASHGCLAQFDVILLLNERGDHLPCPQREGELELERVPHRDCGIDPLEHLAVELWLASAALARPERIPSSAAIKGQPVIDRCPADTKCLSHQFGTFAVLHGSNPTCSQFGELRVCQLLAVCISNLAHAA